MSAALPPGSGVCTRRLHRPEQALCAGRATQRAPFRSNRARRSDPAQSGSIQRAIVSASIRMACVYQLRIWHAGMTPTFRYRRRSRNIAAGAKSHPLRSNFVNRSIHFRGKFDPILPRNETTLTNVYKSVKLLGNL
jgi:hypothetical protein